MMRDGESKDLYNSASNRVNILFIAGLWNLKTQLNMREATLCTAEMMHYRFAILNQAQSVVSTRSHSQNPSIHFVA
jgi:hypothetical protein